jgi:hypothetical protein
MLVPCVWSTEASEGRDGSENPCRPRDNVPADPVRSRGGHGDRCRSGRRRGHLRHIATPRGSNSSQNSRPMTFVPPTTCTPDGPTTSRDATRSTHPVTHDPTGSDSTRFVAVPQGGMRVPLRHRGDCEHSRRACRDGGGARSTSLIGGAGGTVIPMCRHARPGARTGDFQPGGPSCRRDVARPNPTADGCRSEPWTDESYWDRFHTDRAPPWTESGRRWLRDRAAAWSRRDGEPMRLKTEEKRVIIM